MERDLLSLLRSAMILPLWPEVIREYYGNTLPKPAEWAIRGEEKKELHADLIRPYPDINKKKRIHGV